MNKLNKIVATGVLSTAVAGCSNLDNGTKNDVSNILNNKNFGKNSISLVEKKSEKGLKPSDISANNEGFNVSVNQNIGLGMEFLNNSEIFKLEYKKVGEKVGTLATFRYGEKVKSVLLTGVYNGINWSAKTTLGTAKIQNFNQHYLAAEAKKALTSQLFLTGKYETTITKGSKTLSVYEVEEQVTGGKQITKITKKLEGGTSNSWGVGAEYLFNNKNKISANYKSDNKLGASFSHLSEDQKILSTVSYNYQKAKQEFAGKVDTIVSNWGTSVGVYGTYSTDKNYTVGVGVGVSIPLSKSSSVYPTFSQKSTFHNLSHINENSAKYLQNTKQTTKTETLFIANPTKPNSNPEILNNSNNFSFEVGQNINIKIEATDVDGDALSYKVENLPNGLTLSKNIITGIPNKAGNYQVVVSVSDGKGGIAQKTFNIKITEKPVVNPTPTPTPTPEKPAFTINKAPKFSREGKTVTLAYGTAYDVEGNKPQANDTEDGVLEVKVISNNFNPNQAGTYEVVYEAVDTKGAKIKVKDTIIVENKVNVLNPKPKAIIRWKDKFFEADLVKGKTEVFNLGGTWSSREELKDLLTLPEGYNFYSIVFEGSDSVFRYVIENEEETYYIRVIIDSATFIRK